MWNLHMLDLFCVHFLYVWQQILWCSTQRDANWSVSVWLECMIIYLLRFCIVSLFCPLINVNLEPMVFPASPLAPARWLLTSWRQVVTSGDARTRTQATTPRVTSPPTTSVCRCCCRTGSLASSWCRTRGHGTTTSWVSCHCLAPCVLFCV